MKVKESHRSKSSYLLEIPQKYSFTNYPYFYSLPSENCWLFKNPFKNSHYFQILYIFVRAVSAEITDILCLVFSWPGICDHLCSVDRRMIIIKYYHNLGESEFCWRMISYLHSLQKENFPRDMALGGFFLFIWSCMWLIAKKEGENKIEEDIWILTREWTFWRALLRVAEGFQQRPWSYQRHFLIYKGLPLFFFLSVVPAKEPVNL